MKLRNKKTGLHGEYKVVSAGYLIRVRNCNTDESYQYDCIAGFNEEWEDYAPKEPLIKDEKIRKALRAWAECCHVSILEHYLSDSFSCFRWSDEDSNYFLKFCIRINNLLSNHDYTITELCGEEEK